jgi:TonB-linked SusC/RagA family outer membrane protein
MKKIYFLVCIQLLAVGLFGQKSTYQSRVLDAENQEPIPGASVKQINGEDYAVTDANGRFSISCLSTAELEISALGYTSIRFVASQLPAAIRLISKSEQLDDVVVTALGIRRDRQSLSASVAEVDAKALTDVPLTNVVNSLSGQVAGVQVTNGSSGVGSSSRIIIRGENSLSGNNQPLFVVDGVPIRNQQISSNLTNNGALQEVDFGNGASELSPDDMASITVLKGPGSAALYGSRAANGVILITTKRGQRKKGFGISTSNALTFETLLTLPDYQNEYGSGNANGYAFEDGIGGGIADGGIASFGLPLDQGQMIAQFDGPSTDANGNVVRGGDVIARTNPDGSLNPITPTAWVSRPDNIRDFFRTGITNQNNIAVTAYNGNTGVRLSYSNLRNEGILPNADLNRDGLAISLDHKLNNRLRVDLYANYINSRSDNRPNLGYGYENVMYGFNWTGRQMNIAALEDYWQAGQVGTQHYDFNYLWLTNPYLTLYENTNSFNKNRVLGNAAITYDITEKLSLRLRSGTDIWDDNRAFRRAISTNRKVFGGYREDNVRFTELNTDVLLTYKDRINSAWKYNASIGANRFDQQMTYQFTEAEQLAVPEIFNLSNSRVPLTGSSESFQRRINSVYALANFQFRNQLFLDLTLRNDWSSTLPTDANSFAYYSLGAAYVLTNAIDLPEFISFVKVRANASSVGNDTDPYQLTNTFRFNQNYGSDFRVTNENILKNAGLKPERLNAYEVGLDLWFFNNRIQLDVSAFQNVSINQIIGRPISQASGFSNIIENGGEVRTRGFEAMLSAKVIQTENFTWKSSVNYSAYRSIVTQLPNGVDQYVTGQANVFAGSGGSNTVFYIAREGGRVGDMYGSGFVEVDGRTLYNDQGLPVQDGTLRLLGNYNPDFSIGFNNEFSYKAVTLGVLFDARIGGTLVSRTRALGSTSGVLSETLEGREGGIVGDGIVNVGTDENPVYEENTTVVSASSYYNNVFDRGNEASALYDASYLKLRQVSLYYTLPKRFANAAGFQKVMFGFVGSNLLLFTENPHIDPELNAMQETNYTFGVEDMSYPSTRSYGFSIKTEF